MIKKIYLSRGLVALVSVEDYDWILAAGPWFVNSDVKGNTYACRYADGKRIYMHREITKCPVGLVVDHINGNKLDNRRSNLRVCTKKQNQHNVLTWGLVQFRGVTFDKKTKRFRARISESEERTDIHLGYFKTADEAAHAYDRAALILFGEYAWLNFPIERKETEVNEQEFEIPF